jgi:regulator of sigma E protease
MTRLLYLAPALLLTHFIPGAGFWGPVILLVGLIFFHELGHFLVAKWMGLPVEVFSLGFPAGFKGDHISLFKWQETDVRLSILPLGGYVKLVGYNPEEPEADDPNGFLHQPTWKKLAFFAGGITANVLITVVIFFGLGTYQANITAATPKSSTLLVLEAPPGLPAAAAGLRRGDEIQALGDLTFPGHLSEDALHYIQARPGQPIRVTLVRAGSTLVIPVVPKDEAGKGKLGIQFQPTEMTFQRRPFRIGDLGTGARYAVVESSSLAWEILGSFGKLVSGRVNPKEVSGPIGILRIGSQAAKAGLVQFLGLIALISMNLAILNALPIPLLDGGHAAMLLIEKARGRDLSALFKERVLTGGFFFLATLISLVIAMDFWKLIKH